jgi:hypothetical protein
MRLIVCRRDAGSDFGFRLRTRLDYHRRQAPTQMRRAATREPIGAGHLVLDDVEALLSEPGHAVEHPFQDLGVVALPVLELANDA